MRNKHKGPSRVLHALRPPILLPLVASLASLAPPMAGAAGFGELVTLSALGEPLRVEIRLLAAPGQQIEPSCIRLFQRTGDDLPWVRNAKVTLASHNRVLVAGQEAVQNPIMMLGLKLGCGSELQREYPLLLQPPVGRLAAQPPAVVKEAPPQPVQRKAERPRPAEQELSSPRENRTSSTSAPAARKLGTGKSQTESQSAQSSEARKDGMRLAGKLDRLELNGDEPQGKGFLRLSMSISDPSRVDRTSEAERDRLRQEQRLIQSLDTKIITQLEIADRLRQLEAFQASLNAQAAKLGVQAQTMPPAPTRPLPSAQPAAAPPPSDAPAGQSEWLWPAGLALGTLAAGAGLVAFMRWRRRSQEYDLSDLPPLPDDGEFDELDHHPSLVTEEGSPPITEDGSIAYTAPIQDRAGQDWPEQALAGALESPADEQNSALELAEIMMSFGRVQGAAETLADYIRQNPRQAVEPWVKLLEVYRAAGMRAEFEALTRQLNKTFNVKIVSWDEFDQARKAPDTIEQMPHIIKNLQAMWGTPAAQAYIHKLMRDNRDGTRQGFPLNVVDDLLMLLAVLEQECGPYRPTAESEAPSSAC